jgi:hypothetical protein
MIFHRDNKNRLDLLRAGIPVAQCNEERKHAQRAETSNVQH